MWNGGSGYLSPETGAEAIAAASWAAYPNYSASLQHDIGIVLLSAASAKALVALDLGAMSGFADPGMGVAALGAVKVGGKRGREATCTWQLNLWVMPPCLLPSDGRLARAAAAGFGVVGDVPCAAAVAAGAEVATRLHVRAPTPHATHTTPHTSHKHLTQPSPVMPRPPPQSVLIPVVDTAHCDADYPLQFFPATQICAGNHTTGAVDTCLGDSGGPIMAAMGGGGGGASGFSAGIQVGLTSFGSTDSAVSVYTRISAYGGWIRERVPGIREATSNGAQQPRCLPHQSASPSPLCPFLGRCCVLRHPPPAL